MKFIFPPEGITPTPVESDDGAAPPIATAAGAYNPFQQQQQQQQRPGRHPERVAGGERPAGSLPQRDPLVLAVQAASAAAEVVVVATRLPCRGIPARLRVRLLDSFNISLNHQKENHRKYGLLFHG